MGSSPTASSERSVAPAEGEHGPSVRRRAAAAAEVAILRQHEVGAIFAEDAQPAAVLAGAKPFEAADLAAERVECRIHQGLELDHADGLAGDRRASEDERQSFPPLDQDPARDRALAAARAVDLHEQPLPSIQPPDAVRAFLGGSWLAPSFRHTPMRGGEGGQGGGALVEPLRGAMGQWCGHGGRPEALRGAALAVTDQRIHPFQAVLLLFDPQQGRARARGGGLADDASGGHDADARGAAQRRQQRRDRLGSGDAKRVGAPFGDRIDQDMRIAEWEELALVGEEAR